MLNTRSKSAREAIDPAEQDRLKKVGALIGDSRRSRPNYFDGRFLTASDLTADQTYFLSRQADLARSSGFGVIEGLMVTDVANADASSIAIDRSTIVRISAGYGLTPSGELVAIPTDLDVNLADLAGVQRLNAAFGLAAIPNEPLRTATGLFVLGLRPVEYTEDPIASYPTSPGGDRKVQDGMIREATVVSLIPYEGGGNGSDEQGRSGAARAIFLAGSNQASLANVLPIAMLALSRGVVKWVDCWLVRRELGGDSRQILALGGVSRALREAHAQQYAEHLKVILDQRTANSRSLSFSAAEHFSILPPVGQFPAAAIQIIPPSDSIYPNAPNQFTQIFFPPEIEVDLSIIPEDELAAVVEDSLLLPPIDLTLTAEARDSIAVLVLIPVPRQRIQELNNTLRLRDQPQLPPLQRQLLPAAAGQLAKRLPIEVLQGIRRPRPMTLALNPQSTIDKVWQGELNKGLQLWFVRRRNFAYRSDFVRLQEVES
jgi:hypothetical protein